MHLDTIVKVVSPLPHRVWERMAMVVSVHLATIVLVVQLSQNRAQPGNMVPPLASKLNLIAVPVHPRVIARFQER